MTKPYTRVFNNGYILTWDENRVINEATQINLARWWSYNHCRNYLISNNNLIRETMDQSQTPSTEKFFADQTQEGGNHYKSMEIQPWNAMESWLTPAEFIGFLKGNIIKYQARAHSGKGSHAEHMKKSEHYQQKLKEFLSKHPNYPQTESQS